MLHLLIISLYTIYNQTAMEGFQFATISAPLMNNMEAKKARSKWLDDNQWNTISPNDGRDPPSNMKYMVVGVDTMSKSIVEIAWKLYDADGNCLESKQYLLKPNSSNVITPQAIGVHGITTKVANDLGSDKDVVLDEFTTILRKVPNDGFVVAHDMKSVDAIIVKSLNPEQQIVWNVAPKCDTYPLQLAEKYLPAQSKASRRNELLKKRKGYQLSELHLLICGRQETNSLIDMLHTAAVVRIAAVDSQMIWGIFEYYKQHASDKELKWRKNQHGPFCLQVINVVKK